MRRFRDALRKVSINQLLFLLAVAETLHNLEEALWLPAWVGRASLWHPDVSEADFRIAIALLTVVLYGLMYYCAVHSERRMTPYLLGGMAVMILCNVFVPHVAGTILTGQFVPGVVSGVLLNIPVTVWLLWKGLDEKILSRRKIVVGGVAAGLCLLPILGGAFAIGGLLR